MKTIKLTSKEYMLVVQALLFTGCVDVCNEKERDVEYIGLAIKIGDKNLAVGDLSISKISLAESPGLVKKIKKHFNIKTCE